MQVAIVGGGMAGLAAADELACRGAAVTLLEGSARFGGQVQTEHRDGFLVELGAEGFVARSVAVPELCRRYGLEHRLVDQIARRTLGWRHRHLVELEQGEAARLLGIRAEAEDLGRGLRSLDRGMGGLIEAVLQGLGGRAGIHGGTAVVGLHRAGAAWRVERSDGGSLPADAVILAVPPREAADLLAPLLGNRTLATIAPLVSSVTVTLAFERDAVAHPLDASGLVVDSDVPSGLRACTFCSSKFPGRAPPGWCLLRAFFAPKRDAAAAEDGAWVARAVEALTSMLGIGGDPHLHWVSRWDSPLPRYRPDHAEPVAEVRRQLRHYPGLEIAGAAFDHGGVDGAVRSGIDAARRMMAR